MDDLQLFIGQKAILDKDGEVLVLNDPIHGDDLPGGKMQIGETDPIESLKREVLEETDLLIDVITPIATRIFKHPSIEGHRNSNKNIFFVIYRCNYISGELKISKEHTAYKWVNKDNYYKLVQKPWVLDPLKLYFSASI